MINRFEKGRSNKSVMVRFTIFRVKNVGILENMKKWVIKDEGIKLIYFCEIIKI
jgi:hypothetical protein